MSNVSSDMLHMLIDLLGQRISLISLAAPPRLR
jgi:hypothetical protein